MSKLDSEEGGLERPETGQVLDRREVGGGVGGLRVQQVEVAEGELDQLQDAVPAVVTTNTVVRTWKLHNAKYVLAHCAMHNTQRFSLIYTAVISNMMDALFTF